VKTADGNYTKIYVRGDKMSVAEITVLLNGVVAGLNTTFFRIFEMTTASVTAWFDQSDRWCTQQISVGVRTAAETIAIYNDLVNATAILEIIRFCLTTAPGVAFDHSTLGMSVNLSTTMNLLKEQRDNWQMKQMHYLQMLQPRLELLLVDDFSVDYKNLVANNIRTTTPWGSDEWF